MKAADMIELIINVAFETRDCEREGRKSGGERVCFFSEGAAECVFDAEVVRLGIHSKEE